jgi:hypothetical protein
MPMLRRGINYCPMLKPGPHHRTRAWEPEDGRCRECGEPLETENEQLTGACSFCDLSAADYTADEEDAEGSISVFYDDDTF